MITVMDSSGYVLDRNDAGLDELRKQHEAAAGRGFPVKHEIAAVRPKVALYAHSLHQWFRPRAVECPVVSAGKFGQFAPLDQAFDYFISAANKLLVLTGFIIRAKT